MSEDFPMVLEPDAPEVDPVTPLLLGVLIPVPPWPAPASPAVPPPPPPPAFPAPAPPPPPACANTAPDKLITKAEIKILLIPARMTVSSSREVRPLPPSRRDGMVRHVQSAFLDLSVRF